MATVQGGLMGGWLLILAGLTGAWPLTNLTRFLAITRNLAPPSPPPLSLLLSHRFLSLPLSLGAGRDHRGGRGRRGPRSRVARGPPAAPSAPRPRPQGPHAGTPAESQSPPA